MKEKILVIMPYFYGYEKYIVEEIKKLGYELTIIYSSMYLVDAKYRYFYRFTKSIKDRYVYRYFERKFAGVGEVDKVLWITEAIVNVRIVNLMKKFVKTEEYILYTWDSVRNVPNITDYYKCFSKVLTFDKKDAVQYGWTYRPLFYIDSLIRKAQRVYDYSVVCSVSDERLNKIRKLKSIIEAKGHSVYIYMYCSWLKYVKEKYIIRNENYRTTPRGVLKHKSLSVKTANDIYNKSKCVIDVASPAQSGFTMRTIECVGHECKMITTNKNVREADFYSQDNIQIIEDEDMQFDFDMSLKPFETVDADVKERYSIKAWLNDLLE